MVRVDMDLIGNLVAEMARVDVRSRKDQANLRQFLAGAKLLLQIPAGQSFGQQLISHTMGEDVNGGGLRVDY